MTRIFELPLGKLAYKIMWGTVGVACLLNLYMNAVVIPRQRLTNKINNLEKTIKEQTTIHTQHVIGDERMPEKFYIIKGPDGQERKVFLEIDGKPVSEYFVKRPYVGPVEEQH